MEQNLESIAQKILDRALSEIQAGSAPEVLGAAEDLQLQAETTGVVHYGEWGWRDPRIESIQATVWLAIWEGELTVDTYDDTLARPTPEQEQALTPIINTFTAANQH